MGDEVKMAVVGAGVGVGVAESTATRFGWSYLSLWSSCETAWWNSNLRRHPRGSGRRGVEPRGLSPNLVVGSAAHKFLEVWYMSGWDGDKDTGKRDLGGAMAGAMSYLAAVSHRLRDPDKVEATVRGLMQGYHQRWQNESLRTAPILGGPFVEVELQLDLGNGHLFTARLDTVVFEPDDPEGLWILEHKTMDVSRVGAMREALNVDGQITGQILQLRAHFADRVRGSLGNFLVKRAAKIDPYQRERYTRTQAHLEKFHIDARRRLARIDSAVAEYERYLDAGMSEDEAARIAFDASHQGTQKCVGCEFLALCKNRSQSEWVLEVDYQAKEDRL